MKKILSILLSLALIFSALSVLGSIGFTATAATTDNLLPNPNWDYTYDESTGKYSISGWSVPSIATVSTDDDGSTVVTIATSDTNNTYDLRTTSSLSLSRTSYYKFSLMYKLTDPPSDSFNINNGVFFAFRHSNNNVNKVNFTKNTEWTEASFIMYGGDIGTGAWDLFFNIVSNYSRCTLSVKNPSVTLYNPDDLDYKRDTVTSNLLPETFEKFKYSTTSANYANAATETVDLNGKEVTAFKLTRNNANNDNYNVYFALDNDDGGAGYKLNIASKLDTSKTYVFSAWIKLDNADVYDEATGNWVTGDKYEYNKWLSSYGAAAYFMNASSEYYSERIKTFGEWVQVSYVLNEASYSSWRCRVGINTCAVGCNVYIADMRLKEVVGNISVENAVNMFTNGDLSQYNAETNEFANLNINNQDQPWYGGHSRETVVLNGKEMNALKLTVNPENNTRRIKMAIHGNNIKKTAKYKFSVWVKLENNSLTGTFSNNSKFGNVGLYFHHGTTNSTSTQTIQTKDGWQKMEFVLDESVHKNATWWDLHEFGFGVGIYSMTCDLYVADFRLEELAGGDEERSGGFIQVNRNNALVGDQVQVKLDIDEGFVLKRLYYTDGVDETLITENRATVTQANSSTTYESLASDKVYVFDMPAGKDITIKADYYYYLYGDINGDREFNAIDVVVLKKFVAGLGNEIVPENLDSLEENINIYHVAALRNLFLGEDAVTDVAVANVDSLTTLTPNFQ